MLKSFRLFAVAAVLGVALCTAFATTSHAATVTDAHIRDVIKQYIKDNGADIVQTLNQAMADQAQKQQEQAMEDAFKHPQKDVVHSFDPSKGPKDAPITIIEYADFQCPFCERAFSTVEDVFKKYDGKIHLVHKNLPLPFHPNARPAARAAMAAAKQGKFWEFHDKLFENQQYLGDKLYDQIAKDLKLDMTKFHKDMKSDAVESEIKQDETDAQKVGANGTPYFLINGVPLNGAQPQEAFDQVIQRLLKEHKK